MRKWLKVNPNRLQFIQNRLLALSTVPAAQEVVQRLELTAQCAAAIVPQRLGDGFTLSIEPRVLGG